MNAFKKLSLVAALVVSVLAGCGGGTTTASGSSLGGTAAVGSPIVGGTIALVCAGGSAPATVTTGTVGDWSVTLTGQTLPCVVQVSGGTIDGVTNTTSYHSVANTAGTVNVTPITDLVVSNLAGSGTPATWFAGLNAAAVSPLTPTAVTTALTQVKTALGLSALTAINPLTVSFNPTSGNAMDDVLTALQGAITSNGTTLAALRTAASGSTFTPPVGFSTAINTAHGTTSSGGAAAPAAPTGLVATATSSSQINLSWSMVSGALSYNVYAATATGVALTATNKKNSTLITALTYSGTGLTAATTYYIKVTALNAAGESVGSSEATATTQAAASTTPTITSFTPATGAAGTSVSITGTNLNDVTQVLFTGPSPSTAFSAGALVAKAPTFIATAVPAGLAAGSYTVSVVYPGGEAAATSAFTVSAATSGGGSTVTATGMTVAPAANGLTSFPNAVPAVTVQGADRLLSYRKTATTPSGTDYFDIAHQVVGGDTYLSIDLRVGNAATIGGNAVTNFVSHTLFCTLIPATTPPSIALCSTKGIVFDKTAGSVTMTNTPLSRSVVVNGSFSFTPF